jgi:hypothetical protein
LTWVDAVLDEAGASNASLLCVSTTDARRGPENGEDVDGLPPAKGLPAPGKVKVFIHVFIRIQRLGFRPSSLH